MSELEPAKSTATTMNISAPSTEPDGLTELLSRLPMELRLQIYWLSLPLIRHRKGRVDTALLTDISWIGSSRPLFEEVSPIILRDATLVFHTSLTDQTNLIGDFDIALDTAFSGQAPWATARAYQMVRKIIVLIKFPWLYVPGNNPEQRLEPGQTSFCDYRSNRGESSILQGLYVPGNDLGQRLERYFHDIKLLANLEEVQISLAPEMLLHALRFSNRHGDKDIQYVEKQPGHFPFLNGLKRNVAQIHQCFSDECLVFWRFDSAGMPQIPIAQGGGTFEKADVLRYLRIMNEYVEGLLAQTERYATLAAELAEVWDRRHGVGLLAEQS